MLLCIKLILRSDELQVLAIVGRSLFNTYQT